MHIFFTLNNPNLYTKPISIQTVAERIKRKEQKACLEPFPLSLFNTISQYEITFRIVAFHKPHPPSSQTNRFDSPLEYSPYARSTRLSLSLFLWKILNHRGTHGFPAAIVPTRIEAHNNDLEN